MLPSLLFLPFLLSVAAQSTLYHRFLPHPALSATPFLPLARISDGAVDAIPASDAAGAGGIDDGKGWYQVALQRGDEEEEQWIVSSTKASYLTSPPKLRISTDPITSIPSHIALVPSTSASSTSRAGVGAGTDSVRLPSFGEVVVEFDGSVNIVKSPQLATPPPLDPTTGAAITPPPEKSFFQKYWMYVIGIALFAMVAMGPDEPRPAAGGGGGGQ